MAAVRLGTDNQNLPGFIAMCPGGYPIQESQNWQAGFLPGVFRAPTSTPSTPTSKLIEHIRNRSTPRAEQRRQLDLLKALNEKHKTMRPNDPQLEARIQSFELAYRMQVEATDAFDVSREPKRILEMYGPGTQARQILIARRLIERGVRFVQVWHGQGQPWDSHDDLEKEHRRLAKQCDQAIGALLKDLKQRGLLDETLVIWGGDSAHAGGGDADSGSNAGRLTAATTITTASPCTRRRREGRHGGRRDRRVRLRGRREQGPRSRPARHAAAPLRFDHESSPIDMWAATSA